MRTKKCPCGVELSTFSIQKYCGWKCYNEYHTQKQKPKKIRPNLTAIADRLWSQFIRKRAMQHCEFCGNYGSEAHHIIGRRNNAVRWDIDNGIYLCHTCHAEVAHGDPAEFGMYLAENVDLERLERLNEKATKVDRTRDMEDIISYLRGLVEHVS